MVDVAIYSSYDSCGHFTDIVADIVVIVVVVVVLVAVVVLAIVCIGVIEVLRRCCFLL